MTTALPIVRNQRYGTTGLPPASAVLAVAARRLVRRCRASERHDSP
jgi:hypothetical protein